MDLATIVTIVVVGIIVVIGLLLLGDYLGYKVSRRRLATWGGLTVLGLVVLYAIYAIITFLTNR